MTTFFWFAGWLIGLFTLAYHRASIIVTALTLAAGLLLTTFFAPFSWLSLLLLWIFFGGTGFFLYHPEYKKRYLIHPAYEKMSKSLPVMSETEKVALEAGTVSWDGELFKGQPQWEKLLTIPVPKLSEEEAAFIAGPVKEVCEMVNDWEVTHTLYDLPSFVWEFLKQQGFFGLIIPKKYSGKGFSEYAHSEILTILAGRSLTLSSVVAVPNSLGPAELLLRYGTQEQKDHYLPRLARGQEIPCFALTTPDAGSDAGAIADKGIVTKGMFQGKEIIGLKLNWNKRYITLAPVATLLGLAFKMYDPDGLLGEKTELGITCALIPTNTPGITIGRRHLPSTIPFQNGPTQGKDVFIPLDWIIGGENMAGQGWKMLVECLSTGRAISLPAASAGGARMAIFTTSAYSLIRRQFRTSLANFEGIQEALARMAGLTYLAEAVRYLTVAMINTGERPSVLGAIAKYHVTELSRKIITDAMDVHGGKGIMQGPHNYLARGYQAAPIGITVEGANILTRNMIIFGQGAVRCHPYVFKEMQALAYKNLPEFEHLFGEHLSFTFSNLAKSFFHAVTFSKFAHSPVHGNTKPYFQQLTRASAAFTLIADVTMGFLGGKLKFKENLSAKLGDLLAMMYMVSAVLKRFQDEGSPSADLPIIKWSLDYCLANYWQTMDALLRNFPNPTLGMSLRVMIMPFGIPCHMPPDSLNPAITQLLTTPSETRKRLLGSIFISKSPTDSVTMLDKAFQETCHHSSLLKRLYDAIKNHELAQGSLAQGIELALNAKVITEQEANQLRILDILTQEVIMVDDFSSEEFTRTAQKKPVV